MIFPPSLHKEVIKLFDQLEDISISRLKTSALWGIEVPNDKDHVIYVWFDALLSYISVLDNRPIDSVTYKVQVIGKDILKYVTVIF